MNLDCSHVQYLMSHFFLHLYSRYPLGGGEAERRVQGHVPALGGTGSAGVRGPGGSRSRREGRGDEAFGGSGEALPGRTSPRRGCGRTQVWRS